MDEFCPSCRANIGFGTFSIIGCPLCGAEPEFDEEDFDDEFEDDYDEEFPPPPDPMQRVMRNIGGLTEEESDAFGIPFPDGDIDETDDEFDGEVEEKESRKKVSVRSRTSHRTRPRTRTKKKPAKKG